MNSPIVMVCASEQQHWNVLPKLLDVLQLVVPSTLSIAWDDPIPLAVSVLSPQNPSLVKLLAPSIRVQMIKRTQLWVNGGRMGCKHDYVVGNAIELSVDEKNEGARTSFYEVRAGTGSAVASWGITSIATQQVRLLEPNVMIID